MQHYDRKEFEMYAKIWRRKIKNCYRDEYDRHVSEVRHEMRRRHQQNLIIVRANGDIELAIRYGANLRNNDFFLCHFHEDVFLK